MIPVMMFGADRFVRTVPFPGDQIAMLADPARLAALGDLSTETLQLVEVVAVRPTGGILVKSEEGPDILLDNTSCHAWVRLEKPPYFRFAPGYALDPILAGWLSAFTALSPNRSSKMG